MKLKFLLEIDVQGIFVRLSEWVMFVSFQVDGDI